VSAPTPACDCYVHGLTPFWAHAPKGARAPALRTDMAARGCVTASGMSQPVHEQGAGLMTSSALPPSPARLVTIAPVPPWARRAAAAVLWTSMPSALWRFAVVLGVPLGLAESEYDAMLIPGWGYLIVSLLSVLQEALAFLTLGLVRPWGEVWPRWVPRLRRTRRGHTRGAGRTRLHGLRRALLVDDAARRHGDHTVGGVGDDRLLCADSGVGAPVGCRHHALLPASHARQCPEQHQLR
jgi:hypothetical protein